MPPGLRDRLAGIVEFALGHGAVAVRKGHQGCPLGPGSCIKHALARAPVTSPPILRIRCCRILIADLSVCKDLIRHVFLVQNAYDESLSDLEISVELT